MQKRRQGTLTALRRFTSTVSAFSSPGEVADLERTLREVRQTKESYLPLLRCCDNLSSLRRIHQQMIQRGVFVDKLLKNVLVEAYGKCGSVEESRAVFDSIQDRDGPNVFSWTVLIGAYARNGHIPQALELFFRMELIGVRPTEATFVVVLGACGNLGAPRGLEIGKKVEQQIDHSSWSSTLITALLDMHSKCGCERRARDIFEGFARFGDTVLWTAMMAASIRCGDSEGALSVLGRMAQEGVRTNRITLVVALTACSYCCPGSSRSRKVANQIHEQVSCCGLDSDPVLACALINVSGKQGNFQRSWKAFQKVGSAASLSCWNSAMLSCARNGFREQALELYHQMARSPDKIVGDEITFSIALTCCESLQDGEKVLSDAAAAACDRFDQVKSAAIDLYARLGDVEHSRQIFEKESNSRSLSCWNAVIGAYAQHGHARQALELLLKMKIEGVRPDGLTFISAMFASSHAGLLERGVECFVEMETEHGIAPSPEHWRCLIDLLGRAGQMDGAHAMIEERTLPPSEMEWSILLGAYRNQNYVNPNMDPGNSYI